MVVWKKKWGEGYGAMRGKKRQGERMTKGGRRDGDREVGLGRTIGPRETSREICGKRFTEGIYYFSAKERSRFKDKSLVTPTIMS